MQMSVGRKLLPDVVAFKKWQFCSANAARKLQPVEAGIKPTKSCRITVSLSYGFLINSNMK